MRNVIVTGGSRGLGLGLARRLTRAGYRVIALARKETNQLTLAMEEAERAHPGSFHFVPFDLTETAAISALVKRLRTDHGPIYGLVNNAAIEPRSEEHTSELQSRLHLVCRLLLEKKKKTETA